MGRPVLGTVGETIVPVGPTDAGQKLKSADQLIAAGGALDPACRPIAVGGNERQPTVVALVTDGLGHVDPGSRGSDDRDRRGTLRTRPG